MMKLICSVLFFIITVSPSFAWNAVGHRTVAEIAWRNMSPQERQAATDLLKHHPHYKEILIADVPPDVDTNEWAFLTAAIWPDLVRPAKPGQPFKPKSITKYNTEPHGIDLPFLMPGDTNRQLLANFPKPNRDLRAVISESISRLSDTKASPHDRAVSLALLLHLMADSHQPLHTAVLLTKERPKGTALGGLLAVRTSAEEDTNLHTFWDSLPGMDYSFAGIADTANKIMADPQLQRAKLGEYRRDKTVASWIQESHETAVDFAYAPGRVQFVDVALVKSGQISKNEIPMLSDDYVRDSREVTRRRLALAAWRLTDILKDAF